MGCFQRFLLASEWRGCTQPPNSSLQENPCCTAQKFWAQPLFFPSVKWDHNPDLREVLYRLYSLCVKCPPVGAMTQTLASSRAPHKSLYITSHKAYDFVDLENPPSQGSCAGTDRRHSRVWATPLMTLSDATANTYCHNGSYSNTIN